MHTYRVFDLCPSGSVTAPGRDFQAESDAASVARVALSMGDLDQSIWQGSRFVAELDHKTKAPK
ncbi:hypothetical protein W911_13840 [Hyphomicrobium nitrativorans NL23]|uniref:Uncharacterized protein n=1 Tax=Hyphomicrobium nitrativorans NL23 TaxID=1029756 RepID=V5SIJ6_9HYPH|nr:hypothetical protein [Hyphomicrobium nitrativorans]AHB50302.1 hypothetical protein W911_13840 [Hyphomicrobium nitrativorans NL23]